MSALCHKLAAQFAAHAETGWHRHYGAFLTPRLSVPRRWRLTVIVWAVHARGVALIQLGLDPIKDPIDPLGHLNDQSLGLLVVPFDQVSRFLMILRDPIDHLPMFLLNQRNQPLAFCCNQIDHMATPIFALLRKALLQLLLHSLRHPQIQPFD
jgi:hypothetical protein